MENPAAAAQRLLLGTGLGLMLVSGLAMQRGMLGVDNFQFGWAIPLIAMICLFLGLTMGEGKGGFLLGLFPDENDEMLAVRMKDEVALEQKDLDLGGAWAKLEANLLSEELSQEE